MGEWFEGGRFVSKAKQSKAKEGKHELEKRNHDGILLYQHNKHSRTPRRILVLTALGHLQQVLDAVPAVSRPLTRLGGGGRQVVSPHHEHGVAVLPQLVQVGLESERRDSRCGAGTGRMFVLSFPSGRRAGGRRVSGGPRSSIVRGRMLAGEGVGVR